jgi:hypothetical protein
MPAVAAIRLRIRVTIWRLGGRPALDSPRPVSSRCAGGEVVVDEFDQLGMQGDVAVVVELAYRDVQPVALPIRTTASTGQGAQLSDPHSGACQKLDD